MKQKPVTAKSHKLPLSQPWAPMRNPQKSVSEDQEKWENGFQKVKTSPSRPDIPVINATFTLKTQTGTISYSLTDSDDYTAFASMAMTLLCSFEQRVDALLVSNIKRAIEAYNENDDLDNLISGEDQEYTDFDDKLDLELEAASVRTQQWGEAFKLVSNLPKTALNLRVVYMDEEKSTELERIISRYTDLPPIELHKITRQGKRFELPYDKATELYVKLRILGAMLSIKPIETKTTNKEVIIPQVTGLEKINDSDGIVTNVSTGLRKVANKSRK